MSNEKANVVPLYKNNAIELAETVMDMARRGELKRFIVIGRTDDNNVFYGLADVDIAEHHEYVAHLQTTATIRAVQHYLLGGEE